MVLASNNEMVLLPVNEPTFGTPRKSQIQVRRPVAWNPTVFVRGPWKRSLIHHCTSRCNAIAGCKQELSRGHDASVFVM